LFLEKEMRANLLKALLPVVLRLLAAGPVAPAAGDDPAFRAFWVDAFHSGFKSTSQINSMVSRALTGNYNAIVAEVLAYHDVGAGGHGAYWDSSILPKAQDISGSFDPLAYLVAQAHAADIEVHAWIVPYRVSTSWPPSGNTLLASHPEWLMVPLADMDGGPATIDGKYVLDPGSPDAQEYLVSIVQELVDDYEIDGVNLDYIRYTQVDAGYPADEDYSGSSLARFRTLYWYSGTPAPTGVPAWNNFRRRTIDEFVRRLRAEIPSITNNPRQPLRLTADLITFGNAPANFEDSSAYELHQNWKHWMQQGWLDAGVPMNYKREYNSDQAQWYRNWVNAALAWRYDRHMVCGQANYLNTRADSVTQLQYSLNAGADGICNYSYYATADEDMDGNWESDWTWYTYVSDYLFTTPVPTPVLPWRDPTSAVEGTLWGLVTNYETGDPVDGALVQVGTLEPTYTDGNGYFVVTMIPADPGGTAVDLSAETWDCPETQFSGIVVWPGDVVRQDVYVCGSPPESGDMDQDGDVDISDFALFVFCMQGPGNAYSVGHDCLCGDADEDQDLDMVDFAHFQTVFQP
jgi:uncharacterized lipoprotein YddW (UPF0748 family)